MKDIYGRKIDYLRVSVTDRCNLKCVYCIPKEGVSYYSQDELLTKDEILNVVQAGTRIGITKIKLTGGEPLVRKDIIEIVKEIGLLEDIHEISMTTNGVYLKELAKPLKEAGLKSVNISLDTMESGCYKEITLKDCFEKVYEGLMEAIHVGLRVKINCVPIKGMNDKELLGLIDATSHLPVTVRFIELMPIGQGKGFEPILKETLMQQLEKHIGRATLVKEKLGNGPAVYYTFEGREEKIGFITALSNEFCESCNRIRLTCNGYLKLCLHYSKGLDLKEVLRQGISIDELAKVLEEAIYHKAEKHRFTEQEQGQDIENHPMIQIGG